MPPKSTSRNYAASKIQRKWRAKRKPKVKNINNHRLVMNRTTITKKHLFPGISSMRSFGSDDNDSGIVPNQTFAVYHPLNMARATGNAPGDDWNNRESCKIYARNCRFQVTIRPDKLFLEPFQVRLLAGYFKGDDNAGTQSITPAALKTLLPEIDTGIYTRHIGNRDFYWKYQKTITICPKQIYDANGSDDAVGAETLNALVCPVNMSYNFKFNKVHDYEGNDGDSLQGWAPLIALQCMPMPGNSAFQRKTLEADTTNPGSRPGPITDVVMTTYFNDCH